jgi:hypothetical protein
MEFTNTTARRRRKRKRKGMGKRKRKRKRKRTGEEEEEEGEKQKINKNKKHTHFTTYQKGLRSSVVEEGDFESTSSGSGGISDHDHLLVVLDNLSFYLNEAGTIPSGGTVLDGDLSRNIAHDACNSRRELEDSVCTAGVCLAEPTTPNPNHERAPGIFAPKCTSQPNGFFSRIPGVKM